MIKKALICALIIVLPLFGGCWNYRGLDKLSIVSGFAIDKDNKTGLYELSFQIVDLSGNVNIEGIRAKILNSEGKTLFDACRNAKEAVVGKLYFGQMQLVVISEDIAREEDLRDVIDLMLHDSEMRETLKIVISTEKSAAEILKYETLVGAVTAFDINKYIQEDNRITASTSYKQLYEVYNELETDGIELTLPAICNVDNNGEYIAKLCGTAVYKGERLVGYLDPDESKYFLFTVNKVEGGLLTFPADGKDEDNVTLEIAQTNTGRSYSYENGKLVIKLDVDADMFLMECDNSVNMLDKKQVEELEATAAKTLAQRMVNTIQVVQSKYGSDIFGFGSLIYKANNSLWKKLRDDWDTTFKSLDVQIDAKINIVNSALVKE